MKENINPYKTDGAKGQAIKGKLYEGGFPCCFWTFSYKT
jgi:hypothetical protein